MGFLSKLFSKKSKTNKPVYIPQYFGGLKSNLSCYKQNNLYNFDKSIYNIFKQEEKEKQLLYDTSRPSVSNLTSTESEAIKKYTKNGFIELNALLRDGQLPKGSQHDLNYYKNLQDNVEKALDKFPDIKTTSYRQVSFRTLDELQKFESEHIVGSTIQYPSFTSTSLKEGSFNPRGGKFRGVFMIHGETGKAIENYSKYQDEFEILFKPNTKFEVVDKDWVNDNTFAAILKEIKNEEN